VLGPQSLTFKIEAVGARFPRPIQSHPGGEFSRAGKPRPYSLTMNAKSMQSRNHEARTSK
jgi:hypothetical protein